MTLRWFIIVSCLWFSKICFSKTIVVAKNSNVISIANALEMADSGDSIKVLQGTYFEKNLIITKSVTLYTLDNARIDANHSAQDIFIIKADSVCISGFQLVNVGVSFLSEAAAIRVVHSRHSKITDNHIDTCFFGIYIEYGKYIQVIGNELNGSFIDEASAGNAIHAWKGDSLTINNNTVAGHRDGIYFEFVNNSKIENNISRENLRYGLHFMFSNDDVYKGNIFENNGAGVAVMFSKRIRMLNNQFIFNWGGASYGLLLKEISDGTISKNAFVQNTIGILGEGANRLIISNNTFKLNGTALDIKGNCLDNTIRCNDFVANTFEVVTNTKHNNNSFSQNYWSNYKGYDLDRDGYGDLPYRPVNLFAKVTDEVQAATFLIHSPLINLIESCEKIFPQFIPITLVDNQPKIKPYLYD